VFFDGRNLSITQMSGGLNTQVTIRHFILVDV